MLPASLRPAAIQAAHGDTMSGHDGVYKEASTVAEALYEKWFCRYGVPLELITDKGKEFCNRLSDELMELMGTKHRTTTPYHPQCNSQAEVFNKKIAGYLSSFVDDSMLDWELFLAPLMFSYNTSFHRSVLNTPYFLNSKPGNPPLWPPT